MSGEPTSSFPFPYRESEREVPTREERLEAEVKKLLALLEVTKSDRDDATRRVHRLGVVVALAAVVAGTAVLFSVDTIASRNEVVRQLERTCEETAKHLEPGDTLSCQGGGHLGVVGDVAVCSCGPSRDGGAP